MNMWESVLLASVLAMGLVLWRATRRAPGRGPDRNGDTAVLAADGGDPSAAAPAECADASDGGGCDAGGSDGGGSDGGGGD